MDRHRAARAALLAILAGLLAACGHRGGGPTSASGVRWDRITPTQVIEPDRPDWRADSIAFETRVLGSDRVAVAREDGSGAAIEPEAGGANARAPRWVRSGLLLYSSDLLGSEDLWYRDVASGATRRLDAFSGNEWTPAPRPGAPGIVYVEGANPDSGRLVLLPDTSAAPLTAIYLTPASIGAGEPSFNPAGDQVCFSASGPHGTRQIWRLSLSDTLAIQLTVAASVNPPSGPVIDRSPRWSPDGTRILFASNRGGPWGVWTLSPLGEARGLNVIAQDVSHAEIRHPVWSPDGSQVLLSSDRGGDRALWRLSNLP
jgi:dipeptidyl aminopeptidase/acylaminoacyl peptidase